MSLHDRIDSHLTQFEETLTRYEAIQTHRKAAIRTSNLDVLNQLLPVEGQVQQELTAILESRRQLLAEAHQQSLPAANLKALLAALPGAETLADRLLQMETKMRSLREEQEVQALLIRRAERHHGDLLGMVARGGRKQTCYTAPTSRTESATGLLLDTTA